MDIFVLYLWTRLDVIGVIAWTVFIIGGIASGALYIQFLISNDERDYSEKAAQTADRTKQHLYKALKFTVAAVVVAALIPSQKDAAIIAGGWAAKQVVTSDTARTLSSKTLALIEGKLDEELEKLTTKEEK